MYIIRSVLNRSFFLLEDIAAMNELTVNQPADENPAPSTTQRLEQLAERANEAHRKVGPTLRHGLACAYEAGQALRDAFQICPRRKWLAWLAANFKASRWTARRYVAFATECDQLGGLNGATLNQISSDQAGSAMKKIVALPRDRKKRRAPRSRQPALPSPASAAVTPPPASPRSLAAQTDATVPTVANPYLPLQRLFEELMGGLDALMKSDDRHDGPFAELLLLDLKPVYAELMDYLEDRDRLRRTA
jgi:hypothetical protein